VTPPAGILTRSAVLAVLVALSPAALAVPAPIQAMLDCRRIAADADRLACYDRVARDAGAQVLTSPEFTAHGDSRPDFDPAKPFPRPPRTADNPPRVTAVLRSVDDSSGKPVFHLDNGQVWRDQNEDYVQLSASGQHTVTLTRSFMGLGYFLQINGSSRLYSVTRAQ
jgi:hypothetical protein